MDTRCEMNEVYVPKCLEEANYEHKNASKCKLYTNLEEAIHLTIVLDLHKNLGFLLWK